MKKRFLLAAVMAMCMMVMVMPAAFAAGGTYDSDEAAVAAGMTVRIGEESSGTYYATMKEAVAAAHEKTDNRMQETVITLLTGTTGSGVAVGYGAVSEAGTTSGENPINITFDLNGEIYTVKDPAVGSSGTETSAFQLLEGSIVTFKNGTVNIAKDATRVMRMIQSYADVTLDNVTFDASNQVGGQDYAMSFNCGDTVFKGNTNIILTDEDAVAFDVCYWVAGGYTDGLTVTFDESFTGKVSGEILYDSTDATKADLTINGNGTFGTIATSQSSGSNPNIAITGGTFSSDVSAYLTDTVKQDSTGKVLPLTAEDSESVACIGETYYRSLQAAVEAAGEEASPVTITLLQNVEITSTITIPADVTLTAEEGVTVTASTSGHSFSLSNGSKLDRLTIELPDLGQSTTPVNIVYMTTGSTVQNCEFTGGYTLATSDGETSRGIEVASSATSIVITKNTFTNLRQPAYINDSCTGTISGNHVDGTRGWVVCGSSNMMFTGNTFGQNAVDIAIISSTTPGNNYADQLTQISENNDGALVEDQLQGAGNIHVQDGVLLAGTEQELRDALAAAQPGDTVKLTASIDNCANKITLPAEVTLDGDGKSITYTDTGTDTSGAFLTAERDSNNVAVKNITINANNITHGVQFYCNNGGSLENVIVNGGTGTSVIVNGATNVTIKDSQLNPVEDFYATIEYGMGEVVTTAPSFTLNNVTTSDSNGIVVWADTDTVDRVIANSGGTATADNVADVIAGKITTINNDSITIAVAPATSSGGSVEIIETPSTKPVVSNPTYTITNPSVTGGTVTVSPRSASRGRLVTLTVTPDEGYELASLTVTDSRGNTVTLTDAGNGKYTFTMPGSRVVVNAAFQLASLPFTDVAEGAWYYDAIAYVYRNGLMAGVSSTQFAPDSTLNRATLATILWRLAGEPVVNYVLPFEDVAEGEWYSEAIRWAASTGIVNGTTPTTFRPFNSVTREQMAAMVHRYAEYMGYDTTASTDLDTFTDAASVNSYAAEPMGWCVAEGLISGIGTEIRPQSSATRAQIATMLMRFCENIAK